MLTEEGPGSGAPVIALIVDQLFETIKKAVRPMPNGRLNPPVRIILDDKNEGITGQLGGGTHGATWILLGSS